MNLLRHKLLFEAMQFKEGLILLVLISTLVMCSPARSPQKFQELSIDRHRRYKCFLPKDPGPCRGMFRRFYFNKETSQCEQFIYGGCDGNANRFGSIDDCQKACFSNNICSLPKDPGPCRGMFRRFYFNKENSQCEQFIYGGCDGNANRFGSITDCQKNCFTGKPESEKDRCSLPKDPGPCKAMKPRFYFNKETSQCEGFTYGGCSGNANRFRSITDCQKVCFTGKPESEIDRCTLPKDPGHCWAAMPRFYFNKETSQCEKFVYGGCDGNANRFGSIADCQNACFTGKPESEIDRCSLPSDPGRCKMWIPSFYFNRETAKCEKFIYGGCNGNANRFGSIADCQTACKTGKPGKPDYEIDSCSLPKAPGVCLALFPKIYFNTETSQCEGFTYGGCGGNANRFRSIADCQNACSWKT